MANEKVTVSPRVDSTSFAVLCDVEIAGHSFEGILGAINGSTAIGVSWNGRPGRELRFADLAKHFGIPLPSIGAFELTLSKAGIIYWNGNVLADAGIGGVGEIAFEAGGLGKESKFYRLSLVFADGIGILFNNVPVLGGLLSVEDGLRLDDLSVSYAKDRFSFEAAGEMTLFGETIAFPPRGALQDKTAQPASQSHALQDGDPPPAPAGPDDGITWIEINKTISILRVGRVGIVYDNGKIHLYLDAGFSVSILAVDFLGLRLGIPLEGQGFDFGLSGLIVSLDKPPLSITGGLYNAGKPGEVLYSGMLAVKFKDFAITAIGSYGEITDAQTGKKTPSFFIYAALLTPLGGPPCFFITGIALGFGLNRAITMPGLMDVPKFPLVQVVMGGGSLKKNDPPSKALAALSHHIRPSKGDYFAAVGIKFTSFSIISSFALLIVEFGSKLRVSLLGQSVITMPPNLDRSQKPMMYAELALRAVFDFDAGYFEVLAALTNESYFLDSRCKLVGGFAFALWTKGERAGDFIVTLGGCHHPAFAAKKALYPNAEKVGINWAISNNLSLKGLGYFAVTPSCVMAGCDISINYQSGNLSAWLNAWASLYISWKPFHYDVKIGISVGVSYRFKLLWWWVNLRVELGASLHLWGPEFSGTVTIKILVISFTIRFGAGASKSSPPISWNEFKQSFLPRELPKEHGQSIVQTGNNSVATCRIQFTDGILAEGKDVGNQDTVFVSPQELRVVIRTDIPSSHIILQGNFIISNHSNIPGIAPMGLKNVACVQTVTITGENGIAILADDFIHTVFRENVSAALWGVDPKPASDLIKNQIVGVSLTVRGSKLRGTLPSYDINKMVCKIDRSSSGWSAPDILTSKPKEEDTPFEPAASKDKLESHAALLQSLFPWLTAPRHTKDGVYDKPMDYFWATPHTRATGVKWRNG